MKRPSTNASAILLFVAMVTVRAEAADGSDVTLSLSTDQARYYVGEPLHLRIRIKNESDQDVDGFFHLLPVSEQVSIWSRRNGGAFTKLDLVAHDPQSVQQRNEIGTIRLPMKVPAGSEKQSEMYLTRTVASTRVVLDESGVYEFYVECKLWPEKPPIWVRSDVLSVPVDSPTGQQREVLEAYLASDMPALLQFWPLPPPLEKESAERAASFLAKHPHGPYSEKVHAALLNGLKRRMVRKTAGPEEIALYERLMGRADTKH